MMRGCHQFLNPSNDNETWLFINMDQKIYIDIEPKLKGKWE